VQVFNFYARALIADMCKLTPEAPRPSYMAMIDSTNPAGAKLLVHLNHGAGEIEAACSIARRYMPSDLQALTGVSQVLLQALNAARCVWSLFQTLKPGTAKPEAVPGAYESFKLLEELRDGQLIFSFQETQQAGLPYVQQAQPSQLKTPNVVGRVTRLFPNYGQNRIWPGSQG